MLDPGQGPALRRPSSSTDWVDVLPPSPPPPFFYTPPASLVVINDPLELPDPSPETMPSSSPGSTPSYLLSESGSDAPTPLFKIGEADTSNKAFDDTAELIYIDDNVFQVSTTPPRLRSLRHAVASEEPVIYRVGHRGVRSSRFSPRFHAEGAASPAAEPHRHLHLCIRSP